MMGVRVGVCHGKGCEAGDGATRGRGQRAKCVCVSLSITSTTTLGLVCDFVARNVAVAGWLG